MVVAGALASCASERSSVLAADVYAVRSHPGVRLIALRPTEPALELVGVVFGPGEAPVAFTETSGSAPDLWLHTDFALERSVLIERDEWDLLALSFGRSAKGALPLEIGRWGPERRLWVSLPLGNRVFTAEEMLRRSPVYLAGSDEGLRAWPAGGGAGEVAR